MAAKILYKAGYEGQNRLECIEGIEIELLNGQKALIYPKYAVRQMLSSEQIDKWDAKELTEIRALKYNIKANINFLLGDGGILLVAVQ